jgi:hypothetical protein
VIASLSSFDLPGLKAAAAACLSTPGAVAEAEAEISEVLEIAVRLSAAGVAPGGPQIADLNTPLTPTEICPGLHAPAQQGRVGALRAGHLAKLGEGVTTADVDAVRRRVVAGQAENTDEVLRKATEQAEKRGFSKLLICDVDAHHYETEPPRTESGGSRSM